MAGSLLLPIACNAREGAAVASPTDDKQYEQEVLKWRDNRRARLTAEDGWLSVVGLSWLKPGANRIGSDTSSDVVLPKAPKYYGTINVASTGLTFIDASGRSVALQSDADGAADPTTLSTGTLRMFVIKRGDRYGLRVKDSQSDARIHFHGLQYFPIDPKYRVVAKFEPYSPPKKIRIINVLGMQSDETSPGVLSFTLDGRTFRIDPVLETGEKDLFIILKDGTSGKETYGAARYMYATPPGPDGKVVLDFNKLYNPPCAFTAYATCPLPPPQNRLPVRIAAGEKRYGDH